MIGSAARDIESTTEGTTVMEPTGNRLQSATITFDEGLLGFPGARRFALLRTEHAGLFWLQSLDHDPLAFLLLDPFTYFDDYTVDLDASDAAALGADSPGDIAVLAIVTLPTGPDEPCTANLTGPIAINLAAGRGRQVIVRDDGHGVRAVIDLAKGGVAAQ